MWNKLARHAYENNIEALKRYDDDIFEKDDTGRNILHWACCSGSVSIIEWLIETKKFNIDEQEALGWTPLILASSAGKVDAVSYLLKNNANPHIVNYDGKNALFYAASRNRLDIANMLLQLNCDPNVKSKSTGETALHHAIHQELEQMSLLLLENGANPNICNNDGESPIFLAISTRRKALISMLLNFNATTDIQNKDGIFAKDLLPGVATKEVVNDTNNRI